MVSFMQVVRQKYEYKKGEEVTSWDLSGGEKTGRQQALETLKRVFLPEAGVEDPGPDGEIAAVCGAIEELDLEANQLHSWTPVLAITSQLPKLHWLGLNRLPLAPLAELPNGFAAAVGNLRSLCLSSTGMGWGQLLFIVEVMPHLSELHFNGNGVRTTAPATPNARLPLLELKTLFLEGNGFSSWDEVAPLAALPKLEVLNLNYNSISVVPHTPAGFAVLRHLMLRGNPLSGWESIDALDTFPELREARIAELPLTSTISGAVARRLVIARIGVVEN